MFWSAFGIISASLCGGAEVASQDTTAHPQFIPASTTWAWLGISLALLWKVRWFRLVNAAPQQWQLNTNQCALLAASGIVLSGIVGALILRAMGVDTNGPLPPLTLLIAMVAGSMTTILVFLVLRHFSRDANPPTDTNRLSTSSITQSGVINRGITQSTRATATWSKRAVQNIVIGVIGFFIVWPLVQITSFVGGTIQFYVTGVLTPTVGHQFFETIREQWSEPVTWGLVFIIIVLGPLAEEIIWRGAIQQGLKQIGIPRIGAMCLTAVIFALVHWGAVPEYGHAAAIPALAVFGFALGFLMERTGRLWSAFVAHFLFNCANLFLFSMLPQ